MTSSTNPYVFEQGNGYSVITLTPQLNDAQWSDIEQVGSDLLVQLKDHKSPAFVVDLSSLNYMGSAMVALIVRLWKSVKDEKGRMVVVNREKLVYEVLELAGLHKIWIIVETREEALKKLGFRAAAASTPGAAPVGLAAMNGSAGGAMNPAIVGLATLGAIGGLIWLYNAADPKFPLVITVVASLVAIIFGTLSATSFKPSVKAIGLAGVVANLVLIVLAILQITAN
ncbi:MAG: STAS domain-containing protein [Planctomycetaceae bacterium]